MKIIDLRSDTVTKPTDDMLDAMYKAEVGDDNYGEDPTINRLEQLASEVMEKEAALFVPTGTMGNQVAILTHTDRGDEIITDTASHIFTNEMGAPAVISSVLVRPVKADKGVLDPKKIKAVIRPQGNVPRTSMLCIENTHNRAGGIATSVERMHKLCQLANDHHIAVHVDGARIFHASIALGVKAADLVRHADSVMFCLSKGLSAPAGSMLVGNQEFIARARTQRKFIGGQMRQVGYLAAAGIVALEKMVDRLAEDHEKAKILAEGLKNIKGIDIDVESVQTNIVIFDISSFEIDAASFLLKLEEHKIKAYAFSDSVIRMIPTRHTCSNDITKTISAVEKVVKNL